MDTRDGRATEEGEMMWGRRLEKQSDASVLSVARMIAEKIFADRARLPYVLNFDDYILRSNSIGSRYYPTCRIFFKGKKKPFCVIRATNDSGRVILHDVSCNDVDLCVLKKVQELLGAACREAIGQRLQAAKIEADYKKSLLDM